MRRYAKGRAYEYEIKQLFEEAGYTVTRSAGSHGEWDLHCRKQTARGIKSCWIAVYVQCKVGKTEPRLRAEQLVLPLSEPTADE